MLKEFENIITEMDLNLTKYNQRSYYEKKLTKLKEIDTLEEINDIAYEIDFLNFFINNGEIIPKLGDENCCYPNINNFDEDCKKYIKQRFNNTPNTILKNIY